MRCRERGEGAGRAAPGGPLGPCLSSPPIPRGPGGPEALAAYRGAENATCANGGPVGGMWAPFGINLGLVSWALAQVTPMGACGFLLSKLEAVPL